MVKIRLTRTPPFQVALQSNRVPFGGIPGVQGIQGERGEPALEGQRNVLVIESIGQTIFILSQSPQVPHLSGLYLNGVRALYGLHYTLNSTILTWLSPLELAPSDTLEIIF